MHNEFHWIYVLLEIWGPISVVLDTITIYQISPSETVSKRLSYNTRKRHKLTSNTNSFILLSSLWLNLRPRKIFLSWNFSKWRIQGHDSMQEMSEAELNGQTQTNTHTHTHSLSWLTVNSSGRHWMCITLGLQGSHVTHLPKHARQEHTLVTAHTVKQVRGRRGDGERHRDRGRERGARRDRGSLSFRSLRTSRTQTYTSS